MALTTEAPLEQDAKVQHTLTFECKHPHLVLGPACPSSSSSPSPAPCSGLRLRLPLRRGVLLPGAPPLLPDGVPAPCCFPCCCSCAFPSTAPSAAAASCARYPAATIAAMSTAAAAAAAVRTVAACSFSHASFSLVASWSSSPALGWVALACVWDVRLVTVVAQDTRVQK